ncbi:exonuclease VII small subunit [Candidatus Pelagibacter bacterium]|nr:exonuclease VII small subunit [Candidatus Pelagibacter bacterium]
MKDKNLPHDNNTLSLEELTKEANNIIESLESEKDLQNSIDSYQQLLRLNNIIEKKFHKDNKKINEETKNRINKILTKKNEK